MRQGKNGYAITIINDDIMILKKGKLKKNRNELKKE